MFSYLWVSENREPIFRHPIYFQIPSNMTASTATSKVTRNKLITILFTGFAGKLLDNNYDSKYNNKYHNKYGIRIFYVEHSQFYVSHLLSYLVHLLLYLTCCCTYAMRIFSSSPPPRLEQLTMVATENAPPLALDQICLNTDGRHVLSKVFLIIGPPTKFLR